MLLDKLSPRLVFAAIFLACLGLMGFGIVLQEVQGLEPCPMCIMQRVAFIVCGLIALAAAIHNPGVMGSRIYGVLVAAAAIAGGSVAARQSWLQHNPPKIVDCGPDLEFMLDSFPLVQALPLIFRGTGDCSKVQWTFLGLSIAEWSLLWFTAIAVLGIYLLLRPKQT
jgi:disulfide bond formation protein DsbB